MEGESNPKNAARWLPSALTNFMRFVQSRLDPYGAQVLTILPGSPVALSMPNEANPSDHLRNGDGPRERPHPSRRFTRARDCATGFPPSLF